MPDDASIAAALDLVGPRLRRVRVERGVTLTDLAERTGISKSTLSRLENGQRRPSLELLLPLAQAYRVPLDDLVGAPEVGDPRIRLKPQQVHGRTVLPLTRQPNGVQAWKIVIPARQSTPQPRSHDGLIGVDFPGMNHKNPRMSQVVDVPEAVGRPFCRV